MRTMIHAGMALAALAVFGVTGCEQNTPRAEKQADRIDRRADQLENQSGRTTDKIERQSDAAANRMETQAKAIRAGVTYEVATVNMDSGTVTLTRKDLGEFGATTAERDEQHPETKLQAGRDLTLTFAELEKYDTTETNGHDIAHGLSNGENVTVFFDATYKITKIDF